MKTTRKNAAAHDPLSGVGNTGEPQSVRVVRLAIIDDAGQLEFAVPLLLGAGWEQPLYQAMQELIGKFAAHYVASFHEYVKEPCE